MLLYIIRHGDPIYSPDSLTPLGHRQAEALAKRLSVHGLDEIYASPLIRAQQTAQPTCELLHKQARILEWTSEAQAWSEFTFNDPARGGGLNWVFHIQNDKYKMPELLEGDKWYDAEPFRQSNAREGYARIKRESDAFLAGLGYAREGLRYRVTAPNDKRVAVFCHQGFGVTWMSHLLGIHPLLFWSTFDITHSSVTIIEFRNNPDGYCAPMCLALSDTSHIYAERLPLEYNNRLKI